VAGFFIDKGRGYRSEIIPISEKLSFPKNIAVGMLVLELEDYYKAQAKERQKAGGGVCMMTLPRKLV
jgi:hypothetical protein